MSVDAWVRRQPMWVVYALMPASLVVMGAVTWFDWWLARKVPAWLFVLLGLAVFVGQIAWKTWRKGRR